MIETVKFTHLHVHTEYSLLDGAAPVKKLVETAKQMNMDAIAITDHGVMYGAVDFYKAAKAAGIKPIIGCEVYVCPRTRFDKAHEMDARNHHLVLLCKDEVGYRNLIEMVSDAFTEGFYYKPRVDKELLERHSEGLICLSACLAGELPSLLLDGDYEGAKQTALYYQRVFGKENYYIELQDHGLEEQKKTNPALVRLAREIGAPLVCTNDLHYIRREDAKYQDVLMCIQMGKTVEDPDRMRFGSDEFYLKSGVEMAELFSWIPEAVENTNKIAERCNYDFDFSQVHLPKFDVPEGYTSQSYLEKLCREGLSKRYSEVTKVHTDRLEYELGVISSMGYVDYFLIVWDFIKYAKDNGIAVGPGRGSGAGSIVAYTLDITTIDPLRYNLLFERFLNPERVSMPDIDTDFCIERRGEVIDYVNRKYGADRVAQIITFGTLKARAAIRDVGRALNVPLATVDRVAKLVPFDLKMTIEKAIDINPELHELYAQEDSIRELLDTAKAIEGLPRHSGVHAAGVVIAGEPVSHQVPLQFAKDVTTTQYHMDNLSDLGLLKMDFLGLRNLTVIANALENIKKTRGDAPDLAKLDYRDKEVFDLISSGETSGIFQLESAGMRDFMKELRPSSLEDIIAGISLYRPGPMEQIPRYIKNKNHPDKITYKHPMLESILDVTYGCIIYQEQVLQIVQKLAGYSLGKADLLRRAMSKKKHDVMEIERQNFIYGLKDENGNIIIEGAIARGISEEVAKSIFDEIMDFASYAFNKSHAAAYAVVAYQTAYLKAFYPAEYMAALISSTMSDTDKTVGYIFECERMGIRILPPDINKSFYGFTVEDGNLRFGLEAVKNVGHRLLVQIAEEREARGEFKGFTDFAERMAQSDLNKRSLENLIRCGAFDSLGHTRATLMGTYEHLVGTISAGNKDVLEGQLSLFDDEPAQTKADDAFARLPEYEKRDLLAMEKETIGLYLSGHPLDDYKDTILRFSNANLGEINALATQDESGDYVIAQDGRFKDGDFVTVGGIITARRNKTTKSATMMAFLRFEDLYGSLDVIVFPKKYEACAAMMNEDEIVFIKARVSLREDEAPKLILESITPMEQVLGAQNAQKLFIKLKTGNESAWSAVKKVIAAHSGETPVCIFFEKTSEIKCTSRELWCDASDALTQELSALLGEDCVKYK